MYRHWQREGNFIMRFLLLLFLLPMLLLAGCLPNTYYSTTDPYAYGLRWYDRGNYELAAQYWDPLVEKGDCDAEYWVGVLYFLGRGKQQDDGKALALWRRAAEGNQPKAQTAMGDVTYQNEAAILHHCKTCATQRDLVQAYVWYKLAERSARYDGEKKYLARVLQSIQTDMSAVQIKEAEAVLSQWKPTRNDCQPRNWW